MNIFHVFLSVAKMGQAGIISCLALNPRMPTMYAAGSFNRSGFTPVHLYISVLGYVVGNLS